MSSFIITKAKVVNTKNGERLVLESGNDDLKIWMPSTHKDASKLVAGVTVEYETNEKGFHNYKSILAAAPAAATPNTAQAAKPKLSQYVQLFAAVTAEMEACELGAEPDNFWLNVRTVFIQAAKDGILPPVGFKANARIPHGPVEVSEKSEDDLPF